MKNRVELSKLFHFVKRTAGGRGQDIRNYAAVSRLVEIGRLQNRVGENYEPGQVFLHRVFGYRGIVLFPWTAKVYDYDSYYKKDSTQNSSKGVNGSFFPSSTGFFPRKSASPTNFESNTTQTNYEVLVDERDWPYLRVNRDDICILQKTTLSRMQLLPLAGFNHASHDDILPYSPSESEPFKHSYFEQFFDVTQSAGANWHMKQTPALQTWTRRSLPYLKFSAVYRRTTHDIRITVIPYYLGFGVDTQEGATIPELAEKNKNFVWRYSIRLENFGEERVVLREREWEIVDVYGRKEIHKGRGVIGIEPHLSRSEPAFQYSSFMYLRAPRGHMSGAYIMQREDGTLFRCTIPQFELDSLPSGEDEGA